MRRRILVALLALLAAGCAATGILHQRTGLHGDIIVTEEPGGLRTLRFAMDGARQSIVRPGDPEHLQLPYARMAMAGLALVARPERMLVVGLGGGSIPMFLRSRFPEAVIDVAEIDPAVAEVAVKYFGFTPDVRLRLRLGDGRLFMERASPATYDLIVLDAFGAYSVPRRLATAEFLRSVRAALKPDGVAVGNVWNRGANPLHDDMLQTFREVFDELCVLDVRGDVNRIVLALPRSERLDRAGLAQRAGAVSTARGFRFDLGELVEAGWADAPWGAEKGAVLRD